MDRIFNLDAQLIQDAVILLVNVFLLFLVASYFLFNPVRSLIKKRQDLIAASVEDAEKNKEEAEKLKALYDSKMKEVDRESDMILGETRKKALHRETQIIEEAKEEAARIIERAEAEAELEKQKLADDIKRETISVATLMAGRMISNKISEAEQEELVNRTLNEMGEEIWQN